MEKPAYSYVWIPDADSNFVPYSTTGHWIMTEAGSAESATVRNCKATTRLKYDQKSSAKDYENNFCF